MPSIALVAGYCAICELAEADLSFRGCGAVAAEAATVRSKLVATRDFMIVGEVGAGVAIHYRCFDRTLLPKNAHPSYENAQIDLGGGIGGELLRFFWWATCFCIGNRGDRGIGILLATHPHLA